MVKKNHYKRISFNEQTQVKRYLDVIYHAAQFFEDYFINQKVVYCTASQEAVIAFSKTNFMHLCGLYYQKGAYSFYDDSLNRHLKLELLQIKKDGTSFQKLQVLHSIKDLISPFVLLTGRGSFLYLDFDYALRTRKQVLALTLVDNRTVLVPQSLLNLKRQISFPKGDPVCRIYAENYETGQQQDLYLKNDEEK
ncbi:PBECR4 domain-containing protein [Streptococcus mutans]|uniref:PBECR4 domain-containing protein n=1 Tax=Streptococcus mutans TaxID=1309 RepID=UPI0038B88896